MSDYLAAQICVLILSLCGWFAQPSLNTLREFSQNFSRPVLISEQVTFSSSTTFGTLHDSPNRNIYSFHAENPGSVKSAPVQHIFGQEGGHDANCPACEAARRDAMSETDLAGLMFKDAAPIWLENHKRYIAPRTHRDYGQYISALEPFFGQLVLREINVGHLRGYQDWRGANAGHSRINMELSTVQQVLKDAHLWQGPIAKLYRPLPMAKKGAGKSLTPEQEDAILEIATSKTKWEVTGHCLRIMLKTGCGFGELRYVKRGDVDLQNGTITLLEGTKNEDRERTVPLTPSAWASARWLVDRWKDLGGNSPDDYILPSRPKTRKGPWRFDKPLVTIRRATEAIFKAAGVPFGTKIKGFRIYDCRVTAITKTLSSGDVSVHTAKKLFGHVSEAMQKRYYKPQMETLRDAVAHLETEQKARPARLTLVAKNNENNA